MALIIRKFRNFGFTLIELMIAVAIIAILSAIAIPSYQSYIRRSYLNEATTSISAIKSAEEGFFSANSCYINATALPTSIPAGNSVLWPSTSGTGWASLVRPDRMVRFQYEVFAGNNVDVTTAGCGTHFDRASMSSQGCISAATITGTLVPDSIFTNNWYVVVARGDLDNDGTSSTILSAIDDSKVYMCDELE